MFKLLLPLFIVATVCLPLLVHAACECGFRDEVGRIWMDALVLPFDKIPDLHTSNDLWFNEKIQAPGRGSHAYVHAPNNSFKLDNNLALKVSLPEDKTIQSALVSSRRKDLFYGTYRVHVKMPQQKGSTCFGFFSFYNDTEEVDIEYIGQQPKTIFYSTKSTNVDGNFMDVDSYNDYYAQGFDEFRDLRFDWMPDHVDYFIDNELRYTSKKGVQRMPGRLMLMNWANGDKDWSGIPEEQSIALVRNVRVFFNSTHPYMTTNSRIACEANPNSVCDVATFSQSELYGVDQNAIRNFVLREAPQQPAVSPISPASSGNVTRLFATCMGKAFVSTLFVLALLIH